MWSSPAAQQTPPLREQPADITLVVTASGTTFRLGESIPIEGLEMGFAKALLGAPGWRLDADDMRRLSATCITDGCRAEVAWTQRQTSATPQQR